MKDYTIGVSVICMDHIRFYDHVKMVEDLGVDYLHLDIMDGHFVPRYGIYPEIVERICDITDIKMDLHLMVSDPEFALDQFADVIPKMEYVNFHIDAVGGNAARVCDKIQAMGSKSGVALNLSSSFESARRLHRNGYIQSVVFMGIHPGVLKQTPKQQNLIHGDIYESQLTSLDFIQVDGGVQLNSTAYDLRQAGINNFVCGSSTIYKNVSFNDDLKDQFAKMHSNINHFRNILNGIRL